MLLLAAPREIALERVPYLEAERTKGLTDIEFWLSTVVFIPAAYLLLFTTFANFAIFVALKPFAYLAYLSKFFKVFYLISSTLDFSISSSRAQRSRLFFVFTPAPAAA